MKKKQNYRESNIVRPKRCCANCKNTYKGCIAGSKEAMLCINRHYKDYEDKWK